MFYYFYILTTIGEHLPASLLTRIILALAKEKQLNDESLVKFISPSFSSIILHDRTGVGVHYTIFGDLALPDDIQITDVGISRLLDKCSQLKHVELTQYA